MLDDQEKERAEMTDLADQDSIDHPQALSKPKRTPESSVTSNSRCKASSSFRSSITASGSMSDKEAWSPWTTITILAVLIFCLQSMIVWMMPKYFRRASIVFRLAKDVFICILIHPLTGLKYTVHKRKEGLHLVIPNILTVGQVVCWVMMLVTSTERCYKHYKNQGKEIDMITDYVHILQYLILNIQAILIYPIWTHHLKHKHTAAEKCAGLIIFSYFLTDLLGNMAASLRGIPNQNAIFVMSLKDSKTKDNHTARVFLGVMFQAVMMVKWNLSWIFCDVMLETDFHRHTKRSKHAIRESSEKDLISPVLGEVGLNMAENNMVEVWIISI